MKKIWYTLVTLLFVLTFVAPTIFLYRSQFLMGFLGVGLVLVALYNGASFYVDVFPHQAGKLVQERVERLNPQNHPEVQQKLRCKLKELLLNDI